MLARIGWAVAVGVATLALAPVVPLLYRAAGSHSPAAADLVNVFGADLQVEVLRDLPERVTALATYRDDARDFDYVYVGTGPSGGVYRFSPDQPRDLLIPIGSGLGDRVGVGTCEVSSLALSDLNQDGTPELLAETSQIVPIGRPRLYAWSLANHPNLLGMARPDIKSSWSHGLGYLQLTPQDAPRVFSTFCGNGEIVEYHLANATSPPGFRLEGISWRQVGQLPTSGEQALTADADNDGRSDLCIANGYSVGRAAIRIYEVGADGIGAQPRHVIDESQRFANVRFLVGELETRGTNEMVAWWCTDLASGDCEIIRYRLGPEGLCERTVLACGEAGQLWPCDGQMTLADIDQDGNTEVWFVTSSGNLWRYQPNHSPSVTQVSEIHGQAGPLVANPLRTKRPPCLYLGCDRFVLRLQSHHRD